MRTTRFSGSGVWVFGCVIAAAWALFRATGAGEAPPSPVVSLSPNITEIILALGATNRLAGVSDYCNLPTSLDLPRCGGAINPNLERILALRPSTIFVLGQMEKVHKFGEENHIRVASVNVDSSADLYREVQKLGRELQVPSLHLVQRFDQEKRALAKQMDRAPKRRVLLLLGHGEEGLKSAMAVGGKSFMSEMLALAHGENALGSDGQPYFKASLETIIASQPDVIFELRPNAKLSDAEAQKIRDDWKEQTSIPAVKNGRIIVGTNSFLSVPGPRMLEIAKWFAEQLQDLPPDAGR